MRLVFPLAALVLLAAPAYAQTTPPAPVVSPAMPHATAPAPHHRTTMAERFAKANTSHDGHLTLVQAKVGYKTVARHFTEIDAAKKGYVTEADIHAWEKAKREERHAKEQAAKSVSKG